MSPTPDPRSAKVHIEFLKQRGIGEIFAVLTPIVKLLRAIVWWNELMYSGQAIRLLKWKGAQQQGVDYAKDTRVRSNADGEGRDGESCMPRPAGPKPKCVLEILKHFARNLIPRQHFTPDASSTIASGRL